MKGSNGMKELTVDAVVSNIAVITEFVDSELEAMGCPIKVQFQIDVAIDELFGNIAHYAYKDGAGKATVRLESRQDPSGVVITFIDEGEPFNPLESDDPDVTLSADERPIGGLGIFMVKKTMDSMDYEYTDNKNILTIRKNI